MACYQLSSLEDDISHRPPSSLLQLCRERIVLLSLKAVRRIQSGGRLGWLGWPFTCIPNLEPKAFKRHGIRQLQNYLTSVPHLYNDIGTSMLMIAILVATGLAIIIYFMHSPSEVL